MKKPFYNLIQIVTKTYAETEREAREIAVEIAEGITEEARYKGEACATECYRLAVLKADERAATCFTMRE